MRFFFIFSKFLFISYLILFCKIATADDLKLFGSENQEVKIKSKIIDIKRKAQTIEFFDDVIIESGESSLLADWMKVIYQEGGENNTDIEKIIAKGNVKIFTDEFTATSKSGYYDPDKDIFVLEEDVIVNNGLSIASGHHFLYDLQNKKGIFIGDRNETNISEQKKEGDSMNNIDNIQSDGDNRVKVIINTNESDE